VNARAPTLPTAAQITQLSATSSLGSPARAFVQSITTAPREERSTLSGCRSRWSNRLAAVWNLVQAELQLRERPRVGCDPPRAPAEVREHRRPVHELEYERVVAHLENLGNREAVRSRMLHDSCLAGRLAVSLEGAENAAVAEIDDLRGASGGDHSHWTSMS
jgi:hypothetical protein